MSNKLERNSSEDSSFDPCERKKNKKSRNKYGKKFNVCSWTLEQEKKYINFLIIHQEYFESQNKRKSRIFIKMSQCVQLRNLDQCRSHHQKKMTKYGSIAKVIEQMSNIIEISTETSRRSQSIQDQMVNPQNQVLQEIISEYQRRKIDNLYKESNENSFNSQQFAQQQIYICLNLDQNIVSEGIRLN